MEELRLYLDEKEENFETIATPDQAKKLGIPSEGSGIMPSGLDYKWITDKFDNALVVISFPLFKISYYTDYAEEIVRQSGNSKNLPSAVPYLKKLGYLPIILSVGSNLGKVADG